MGCLCIPTRYSDQQTLFHWPNFTFSHSQNTINPRRIHSTFSLSDRPRPGFIRKRPHSLHNGTTLADLRKPKRKKNKRSLKSTTKIALSTVPSTNAMSDQYAPPPGPPPSYHSQDQHAPDGQQHVQWSGPTRDREQASDNPFRSAHVSSSSQVPPPSSSQTAAPPSYDAPPPGPPPNWNHRAQQQQPAADSGGYAPPPGPPPQTKAEDVAPPPYDPWLAVPDNALLPPPPSLREERSPGANATFDDAARAHAWCRQNPLWQPQPHNPQTLSRISQGQISLTAPPGAKNVSLYPHAPGRTLIRTTPRCTDSIFLSDIPLYTPSAASQLPHTIYYEIKVLSMGDPHAKNAEEAGIAIGFLAPPYPSWRLPGWHRASLGVHGDDGRRYVDDSFGGKDFVRAFRKGDVVGIGMTFSAIASPQAPGRREIKVFFTRNGKREAGWDLYEERDRDAEEGEVVGLEGRNDLLAAVGCFGPVEFEARFLKAEMVYKG